MESQPHRLANDTSVTGGASNVGKNDPLFETGSPNTRWCQVLAHWLVARHTSRLGPAHRHRSWRGARRPRPAGRCLASLSGGASIRMCRVPMLTGPKRCPLCRRPLSASFTCAHCRLRFRLVPAFMASRRCQVIVLAGALALGFSLSWLHDTWHVAERLPWRIASDLAAAVAYLLACRCVFSIFQYLQTEPLPRHQAFAPRTRSGATPAGRRAPDRLQP